jgi:site-specific DNA recombinase
MKTATGRAGIYVRISSDPKGEALGVARQEADCRKLCQDYGWAVVEVFCDNDHSAFDPRKTRPAYQEMIKAIKARAIDCVVCWHPDRLHRQTRQLNPFIDLVNQYGVQVATVVAGTYDLSTPSGRMNARVVGATAEYESEHKSERIRRKLQENAANGKAHGGSRPFGWYADDLGRGRYGTPMPDEAAVVRRAADMLLAGKSLKEIVRALNAEGHTTAMGKPWRDVHVRDMLNRPRNAGLSQHAGQIVGTGQWEPIIPEETFWQIRAILSNPARRTNPGRDGRVHLLSTIAKCGLCGRTMVVGTGKGGEGPYRAERVYRCASGEISRNQASVDDLVTRVILGRLALPDAKDLLVNRDQVGRARIAAARALELEDRLNGAVDAYGAGAIDLAELIRIKKSIKPQIERAQAEASVPSRAKALGDLVSRDPGEVWASLSDEQRRAVAALLVDVTILPSRHGRGFDPESVKIEWKEQP